MYAAGSGRSRLLFLSDVLFGGWWEFLEDLVVGLTLNELVVDFQESGLETAGAVGEAIPADKASIKEVLALLQIPRVVHAEADGAGAGLVRRIHRTG